ncbi:MAG: O-antigen ligase family protein [Planctomycetota bacterium]
MILSFEIFLIIAAVVLRLLISGSTDGIGLNIAIGLLVWMALLLRLVRKPDIVAAARRFILLLPAIFGCLVVYSFFIAPYKFGALPYGFAWLTDIVLFYLIVSLNKPYLFISVFAGSAVLISFYGLYQHLWGLESVRQAVSQDPHLLDFVPAEFRNNFLTRLNANEPFATFIYQNSLGGFLVLVIPIILSLLSRNIFTRFATLLNLIISGVLAVMVYVLWSTGAKGAWVAAGFALILFFVLKNWHRFVRPAKTAVIAVSIAGAVLSGVVFLYILTAKNVPDSLNSISDSLNIRYGYWRGAAEIIKHHPFGVGLNQFVDHYLIYREANTGITQKAHNDFLQIGAETGIIGLVVFVAVFGGILFLGLFRVIKGQIYSLNRTLLIGLICGLAGFLLHSMVDFNFYSQGLSMSAWLVAGLIVSLSLRDGINLPIGTENAGNKSEKTSTTVTTRYAFIHLTLIIILLGSILFLSWSICPRLMEYDTLLDQCRWLVRTDGGLDSMEKGRTNLEKAKELNPYSVDPYLELSWFYHRTLCSQKPDEFICIKLLDQAITLSRMSSNLYYYQGIFFKDHSEMYKKSRALEKSDVMLRQSELLFKKAHQLNPHAESMENRPVGQKKDEK